MSSETTTDLTGRALDMAIAERIMGWSRDDPSDRRAEPFYLDPDGRLRLASDIPRYSSKIGAAWTVVERMLGHGSQRVYLAFVRAWEAQGIVAPGWVAARRICEAALAAVAAPKDGG